jgi:hypothetical protein
LVVIAMIGCRSQPVNTGPIEYVGGTDRHPGVSSDATPTRDRAAEREAARIELVTAIRTQIKTDPATAMLDLGLRVDDFESIAKALYVRWRATHSEPRPNPLPPPPPVSAPKPAQVESGPPEPPGPAPNQSGNDRIRWWCFRSSDWTTCEVSRVDCELERAEAVHAGLCSRSPTPGMTWQECVDIAADVRGASKCEWQDRAACFRKRLVLQNEEALACAPSITACKERRKNALKHLRDDVKVMSDCGPLR